MLWCDLDLTFGLGIVTLGENTCLCYLASCKVWEVDAWQEYWLLAVPLILI